MNSHDKLQAVKILSSFNTEIKPLTYEQRETLFKSQMDQQVDLVLSAYDMLEKSEDNEVNCENLQKGIGTAVHKYISKLGDKYVYANDTERKVTPINDLREYHSHKTSLDSVKTSLDGSAHSDHVRELYKIYNRKAEDFKTKYGHGHDSEDAAHHSRMAVAGMMNHIDNRVNQIQAI